MERASKYVIIIYIQVGPNAADKRFAWTNTPMVHRISREEWKDTPSYVIVNLKLPNAVLCCGTHDVKPRDSVLEHSPIAAIQAIIWL